jgi:hypothetical protein
MNTQYNHKLFNAMEIDVYASIRCRQVIYGLSVILKNGFRNQFSDRFFRWENMSSNFTNRSYDVETAGIYLRIFNRIDMTLEREREHIVDHVLQFCFLISKRSLFKH